jgi:hypothetical protein
MNKLVLVSLYQYVESTKSMKTQGCGYLSQDHGAWYAWMAVV